MTGPATRHTLAQLRPDMAASLAAADDKGRVELLTCWLEHELNEHLETCNRWIAIERELKNRIAKARKELRVGKALDLSVGTDPGIAVSRAYAALGPKRGRR